MGSESPGWVSVCWSQRGPTAPPSILWVIFQLYWGQEHHGTKVLCENSQINPPSWGFQPGQASKAAVGKTHGGLSDGAHNQVLSLGGEQLGFGTKTHQVSWSLTSDFGVG